MLAQLPRQAEQDIASLHQAVASLPHIPSSREIEWARGVLSLPNLAIMELDTTDLTTSASILRVTLLDGMGQLVDDLIVHPPHVLSQVALDRVWQGFLHTVNSGKIGMKVVPNQTSQPSS